MRDGNEATRTKLGTNDERAFHLEEFNSTFECAFYQNTDYLIHDFAQTKKYPLTREPSNLNYFLSRYMSASIKFVYTGVYD